MKLEAISIKLSTTQVHGFLGAFLPLEGHSQNCTEPSPNVKSEGEHTHVVQLQGLPDTLHGGSRGVEGWGGGGDGETDRPHP